MKVMLLCGYRTCEESETGLGLSRDENGVTLIDQRIRQLGELGLEVLTVLAGQGADEQLRACHHIQEAEIACDNNSQLSLLSNVKAGAEILADEAFLLLPLEIPFPPQVLWKFLINEHGKAGFNTPSGVIQAIDSEQGAPKYFGFPLLVTRQGTRLLQDDSVQLTDLTDARLKYHQPVYSEEASLAHPQKPL